MKIAKVRYELRCAPHGTPGPRLPWLPCSLCLLSPTFRPQTLKPNNCVHSPPPSARAGGRDPQLLPPQQPADAAGAGAWVPGAIWAAGTNGQREDTCLGSLATHGAEGRASAVQALAPLASKRSAAPLVSMHATNLGRANPHRSTSTTTATPRRARSAPRSWRARPRRASATRPSGCCSASSRASTPATTTSTFRFACFGACVKFDARARFGPGFDPEPEICRVPLPDLSRGAISIRPRVLMRTAF